MSPFTFILRSLVHHRRINLAVACGVMAATAVLTGALLVGDSVRGSLRHLALDRLGKIDDILVTDRFFRAALADELAASANFKTDFDSATPAILLHGGTLERNGGDHKSRASNVLIVGGDENFWKLSGNSTDRHESHSPRKKIPGDGEIILNEPLAAELGVKLGDEVVLRLPSSNQVPADSPLGKKEGRIQTLAGLKIVDIIPAESLGRFGLRSSQHQPRNAYVSLGDLQSTLDQPDKVNAILVAEKSGRSPSATATEKLQALLQPTFEDYGFAVQNVRGRFRERDTTQEKIAFEYFSFTSDRMMIEPAAETIANAAFDSWNPQPVLTYLAIGIEKVSANNDQSKPLAIPYSTITAIDSVAKLGPLLESAESPDASETTPLVLGEHDIVLNRWAADDLKAAIGDKIRITFFEPETTHGQAVEQVAEFTLKAIAPLTEPDVGFRGHRPAQFSQRPTLANDSDLTPTVAGITDQDSINAWDPPFPYDSKRVRPHDDVYWQNHRTTPKAFVSLTAGRKIWSSRFGATTSIRIPLPAAGLTSDDIKQRFLEQLRRDKATLGLEFLPVKYQALAASSGTTPFDGLFLGLSFFIIAAALLLVALLFRLGIEQRAAELGVLLAVGLRQRLAASMLMREGFLVAAIGGVWGVALGVGYAWLMLAGLRTWWLGAIVTPFLNLHITPQSLVIGYVSGLLTSVGMIAWTIRRARHIPVRSLLSGEFQVAQSLRDSKSDGTSSRPFRKSKIAIGVLIVFAVVLATAATQLAGEAQAGCFVGAGMMLLTALLIAIWVRFQIGLRSSTQTVVQLAQLAGRNAGRNPSRSTLTISLMAIASFLIIALSAFRLDPSLSGAGGFNLVAETSQPVFVDLNRDETRHDLFANRAQTLAATKIFGLRLKPGDDASCNNLYQASQPRVIGVTPAFVQHFDHPTASAFNWAASAKLDSENKNPWQLLSKFQISNFKSQTNHQIQNPKSPNQNSAIPVVLDKNTALYSLHLYGGVGQEFSIQYEDGVTANFQVVGLLSNSVLQGSLLVSEADFVHLFPRVSGYRFFLIQTPDQQQASVGALLEDTLGDQGFDTTSTRELLVNLLAVQNTYLSTFQSLGALGLLLGTFGLATVQLRNVFERRKEFALLRATGFHRRRLASMVLLEHLVLLLSGLGVGVVAALVAVVPHALSGGAALPWRDLLWMLVAILVVGILSGFAAVRATLKAPVIGSLRGE